MTREQMTSGPSLATMGAGAVELMDLATQTCIPCRDSVTRLQNGEVEIIWASGWLTRFEPKAQGPLQVRIWAPTQRHPAPPTAIRPGQRLEVAP